jgi:hypothetical protein
MIRTNGRRRPRGSVGAADEKKSTTEAAKTNGSDSWITAKIALFADARDVVADTPASL